MNNTVVAKLPTYAHLDVPEDTPSITISTHRDTYGGRKNAVESARRTHQEYTHTHGNRAAHMIRIIRGGEFYDYDFFEHVNDSTDNGMSFEKAEKICDEANILGEEDAPRDMGGE